MLKAKLGGVAPLKAEMRLNDDVQNRWLGEWLPGREYRPMDKVSRNGSSYICVEACTGVDPETDTEGRYWLMIAQKGADGAPFTYDMFTEEQLEALRGPEGPAGKDGKDGQDGQDGKDGKDGQDGSSGPAGKDGEQGPAGVSGVYVGSGDMPEGYNVQVDPNGEVLEIPPAPKLMTAEEFDAVSDWDAVLREGQIAWRCG